MSHLSVLRRRQIQFVVAVVALLSFLNFFKVHHMSVFTREPNDFKRGKKAAASSGDTLRWSNFFADLARIASPTGATQNEMQTNGSFAFVHISKCAGSSWIILLRIRLENFQPWQPFGAEYSMEATKTYFPELDYLLIPLRSPRAHIWSLFTECKYDDWGVRVTTGTKFPNNHGHHSAFADNTTDLDDFSVWMDHFLLDGKPSVQLLDFYGCYHPANYQSRVFVPTAQPKPQGAFQLDDILPDSEVVMQKLFREADWVGIAEFFHASACLLFFRITQGDAKHNKSEATKASRFLDKHCWCPRATELPHVTHHKDGHRSTHSDLPSDLLSRMDALTAVDRKLYESAVYRFLKEIVLSESLLGRRVLCDDDLVKQEAELAYVLTAAPVSNVTAIYFEMKKQFGGSDLPG